MREAPEVVVVGSASRDLVDDDPRGWRLGGGVSYSALLLARLGLRVGALMVADDLAAGSHELALLRDAGVQVVRQAGSRGPVFVNVERPEGRIQHAPQVSDAADPGHLPDHWRAAGAWLFAPVAAELPDAWAGIPRPGARVALGWQGLLRVLEPGMQVRHLAPGPSPIVRRADLVGVGRDDFDPAVTSVDDLLACLHPGATLLVTDGERGGTAIDAGAGQDVARRRSWHSIPAARDLDPVGAGDTFLAGVFAALLDESLAATWPGADPELRVGAACGSLTLEGLGLLGVPHRAEVLERMGRGDEAG